MSTPTGSAPTRGLPDQTLLGASAAAAALEEQQSGRRRAPQASLDGVTECAAEPDSSAVQVYLVKGAASQN